MKKENEDNKLDINFESVDRFVKIFKVVGIGIIVPVILVVILVVLVTFIIIYAYWHIDKASIIQYLERIYKDEYEIVSANVDDEGNGYYKIAIKGNEEIIFNGYHKGNNTNREDSQAYKLKYYYENLEDQELKENFKPIQSTYKVNNKDEQEFLKYELATYVSNYSEFEEKVLRCYELLQICKKEEIYGYAIFLIYNDYWGGFGQYESELDYEVLLAREKNNYIKYLKEKKLSLKEIPLTDIEKYYRPDYLTMVINGKELPKEYGQAYYNYAFMEYQTNAFQKVVEDIETIEKISYDRGNVVEIKYKGKKYRLHYTNNELKKNSIPYTCKMSYLESLFNAKIEYDYINNKVYITIE